MRNLAVLVLCLMLLMALLMPKELILAVTPSPSPTGTPLPIYTVVPPPSCGSIFNPCGAMPWLVPMLPTLDLPSPTIRPTLPSPTPIPITVTPSPTHTATPSNTPSGPTTTPTPPIDLSSIQTEMAAQHNQLSTLQSLGTQSAVIYDVNGTPASLPDSATQIAGLIGPAISNMKGIAGVGNSSRTFAFLQFLFLILGFVILVRVSTLLLPIILNLVRLIFQFVTAIKP